ncbi:zinc ribbon domain-containing protein [Longimicrobium sp.]|uniref:zinc ribbon domain-containing protein n=1 Tax=Longimicrobium sp. TaxID=2029185 RepID=UPI002CFD453F|nr:zinc ribbon domain-containing protein [Longimicrobium sp.]HSU12701.1 zinc ribbon domain-containing protein [Longimicrobium sp.]
MAKICTQCGTDVMDNFCAHCGARAPRDEPQPVTDPTPAAVSQQAESEPPYGLWLGGFCVLLFLLMVIASVAKDGSGGASLPSSTASAFVGQDAARQSDSVTAVALWARKGSLTPEERLRLDDLVHAREFTFAHDSMLHAAVVETRLDSAEALLRPQSYLPHGFPVAASAMLILHDPLTPAQSRRATTLHRRADAAQVASDRELQAQSRRSQEDEVIAQASCSPSRSKVRRLLDQHSAWGTSDLATIACRQVRIGFDHDRVIAAWGRPNHVNRTTYSFGVHEQWVYGEYGSGYVYFEDGAVTAIQN